MGKDTVYYKGRPIQRCHIEDLRKAGRWVTVEMNMLISEQERQARLLGLSGILNQIPLTNTRKLRHLGRMAEQITGELRIRVQRIRDGKNNQENQNDKKGYTQEEETNNTG